MTIDIDVFGVRMKNSISSDMESYFIFIQKKKKKSRMLHIRDTKMSKQKI